MALLIVHHADAQDTVTFSTQIIMEEGLGAGLSTTGIVRDPDNGDYYITIGFKNIYRYRDEEFTNLSCGPCGSFPEFGDPVNFGDYVYFPTRAGLVRMDKDSLTFEKVYTGDDITSVAVLNDTVFYMTTWDSDIGLIEVRGDQITIFDVANHDIPTNDLLEASVDPSGRIWTYYRWDNPTPGGAVAYENGSFTTFTDFQSSGSVNDLFVNPETGTVWLGLADAGAASIENNEVTFYDIDYPTFIGITGILQTPDGLLWIHNSSARRLFYYDINTEQLGEVSFDDLDLPDEFWIKRVFQIDDMGRITMTGDFTTAVALITPLRIVTSVADEFANRKVSITPTLCEDNLRLELETSSRPASNNVLSVTIHDLRGSVTYIGMYNADDLEKGLDINCSQWSSGLYSVTIHDDQGGSLSQKIIKQ